MLGWPAESELDQGPERLGGEQGGCPLEWAGSRPRGPESSSPALSYACIVARKGPADVLVYHGPAGFRERWTIHRVQPVDQLPLGEISDRRGPRIRQVLLTQI